MPVIVYLRQPNQQFENALQYDLMWIRWNTWNDFSNWMASMNNFFFLACEYELARCWHKIETGACDIEMNHSTNDTFVLNSEFLVKEKCQREKCIRKIPFGEDFISLKWFKWHSINDRFCCCCCFKNEYVIELKINNFTASLLENEGSQSLALYQIMEEEKAFDYAAVISGMSVGGRKNVHSHVCTHVKWEIIDPVARIFERKNEYNVKEGTWTWSWWTNNLHLFMLFEVIWRSINIFHSNVSHQWQLNKRINNAFAVWHHHHHNQQIISKSISRILLTHWNLHLYLLNMINMKLYPVPRPVFRSNTRYK